MEAAGAWDVIIAGAGPAGCSAAICAARSGARVLLLERDRFPRDKVCGEFVSPESLSLLASLLLANDCASLFSAAPHIRAARLHSDQNCLSINITPSARSIPRYELDMRLWGAASVCATCVDKTTVLSVVRDHEQGFEVEAAGRKFRARAVIDATGRWSELHAYASSLATRHLGIKAHFREIPLQSEACDLYFFQGGYCGVQPVAPNRLNVSALVREGVAKSLEEIFRLSPTLLQRSRYWEQITKTVHTFPAYFLKPEPVRDGVLCIGDAAAFIDPFAGDGISLALQSGRLAAKCLQRFLQNEASLGSAHEDYQQLYQSTILPAFKGARWVRKLVNAPSAVRRAAFFLGRLPLVSRYVLSSTRTRASE